MNEALGWTLFHFLWEGAAIALLLAMLLLVSRAARVRYWAACAAMVAMLAAFGITLAMKLPKTDANARRVHVLAGPLPPRPAVVDDGLAARSAAMPYRWAVPLWLAGVVLLSLHRLAGVAGAYRLRRAGVCLAPSPWPERMARLAARLGLRRPVVLLESCLTDVPVAAGYLRPAILLPIGLLAGLPAEQVEFILIHELAHIVRRDYLVNLLQGMVEALLFYHPAVWWVSGVIRAEREHCCDDVVVALAGDPRSYAAALVTLEQNRVPEPLLAATGGSLTKRVRRLLQQPAASQSMAGPLAAAALALAIVGIALAASQPQQIPPPPAVSLPLPAAPVLAAQAAAPAQEQTAATAAQSARASELASTLETPYRKWLNEDVAYIILDQERSAFKSLPTDAEREQFIEQFWLRRDPTPGTVENEFKEEHYRRIAYANEHYGAQQLPGWKTDRGRIYITYGPPDEIEDHSSGGAYTKPAAEGGGTTTTFPFQQWRYRYVEGIGNNIVIEFVDPTMTGEFRMTMDPSEKDALAMVKPPAVAANGQAVVGGRRGVLSTTPSVPPSSADNVFVANEPGGRVTVRVSATEVANAVGSGGRGSRGSAVAGGQTAGAPANRFVMVSLPFASAGPYSVAGKVSQAGGRPVVSFQDKVNGAEWTGSLRLAAGASYVLSVVYQNLESGEERQESVNFFVN
jgi:GWxTD domain-containing protein